jgi:hypothetical protein
MSAPGQTSRRGPTPEEAKALEMLFKASEALRKLGWQDPMYAPKDGLFEVIELSSTGVHIATHFENDHKYQAWILDGDVWPSRPLMIRRADSDLKRKLR